MTHETNKHLLLFRNALVSVLILWCLPAASNDSSAGIAATGIYLKEEKNVSIESEELYVSEKKIAVTYIFKNHSDKDITTMIAFPMPDYHYEPSGDAPQALYEDFAVEINDKQIRHSEEVKALVNGVDYADALARLKISLKDFGNFHNWRHGKPSYFTNLSSADQEMLIKKKLVVKDASLPEPLPNWTVSRKYYWEQTFPANKEIKIKHAYTPYPSKSQHGWQSGSHSDKPECVDKEGDLWIEAFPPMTYHRYLIVDYILTTANNWKQPIKDFRLILDGAGPAEKVLVTTCFPGNKKKIGENKYEIRMSNFVPKENLAVYFIHNDYDDKNKALMWGNVVTPEPTVDGHTSVIRSDYRDKVRALMRENTALPEPRIDTSILIARYVGFFLILCGLGYLGYRRISRKRQQHDSSDNR